MLGVIPAAGAGTRIQPLAFSKELLPVGSRCEGGTEHPRAVSEYIVERMIAAGATRICFVIAPGKFDILQYYGAGVGVADICYVVQPKPSGLCDALFRALPWVDADESIVVGLPDTIWLPTDGLRALPERGLSFLLFPVERPELFDTVLTDTDERVLEIQVKRDGAGGSWVWGAFKLDGGILRELYALWQERECRDVYVGTLINAYLARGGQARGVRAGTDYIDVGTLHGYREATALLGTHE